jgi:hypothetical protein
VDTLFIADVFICFSQSFSAIFGKYNDWKKLQDSAAVFMPEFFHGLRMLGI